ncbi:MAG: dihydrofolate reductase family protein [Desulfobacterales bacterium]|jgi:riboflavin-specific deaminase-like protein|nr:dihydrofolate reductase family protein [Desulfobacterales bacterium]
MSEDTPQGTIRRREGCTSATDAGQSGCLLEEWFEPLPRLSELILARHDRPLVTVSYAQSVDGSIATRNREQLRLSSHQSMVLTHRIRAACDAVVIGIKTLLVDDPLLTVRLIEGTSPQPIVLDSKLRIPLQARLLNRTDRRCWLACTDNHVSERVGEVQSRGAEVIRCRRDLRGMVDLSDLLYQLGRRGIRNIMVEGGSQVITSFIKARLVDQMIITIAPCLVGGLPVLDRPAAGNGSLLGFNPISYQSCGPDIVIWAQPRWQDP